MTDDPRRAVRADRDTLGLRLGLAFVAVALAAIALLAGLTAALAAADVSALANRQRTQITSAIAVAAGSAWERDASWDAADLGPVLELATSRGTAVMIQDQAGHTVAASARFGAGSGPQDSAPIVVRGQRIGTVLTRSTGTGVIAADRGLQTALLRAIAASAGLAALLALLTGLGVARVISRPVIRLIAVTRAMALGDRAVRAGQTRGPGELRELAAAFDQMAGALDHQEQLRRDLVADVAHELRTPIAVLQAGHEALLDGVAEPTPAELTSLRDEVLRLARMVSDLQDLAAADAAALHLDRVPCDLADVAATAADSLARRYETAGTTLELRLSAAPIMADPRWLHQVITNLLTNALKFTPAGGRVTLETARDGTQAVLRVADTGPGIPAKDLPHIFDRFWRGRSASHTSGSGIGLAIADELARAHGGRLAASSEPGHGTQMTLTLPST